MKRLSQSLKILVQPKEGSSTQTAEELTKWLEKLWVRKSLVTGVRKLHLDSTETQHGRPSAPPEAEKEDSKLREEHMLMKLPQLVCECVLFAKGSYKEKSKSEVAAAAAEMPYGDSLAGFELEAWGSSQSLRRLKKLITDEEAKAQLQNAASAISLGREIALVMTVFKNSTSASSVVEFVNYSGPCQFSTMNQSVTFRGCTVLFSNIFSLTTSLLNVRWSSWSASTTTTMKLLTESCEPSSATGPSTSPTAAHVMCRNLGMMSYLQAVMRHKQPISGVGLEVGAEDQEGVQDLAAISPPRDM